MLTSAKIRQYNFLQIFLNYSAKFQEFDFVSSNKVGRGEGASFRLNPPTPLPPPLHQEQVPTRSKYQGGNRIRVKLALYQDLISKQNLKISTCHELAVRKQFATVITVGKQFAAVINFMKVSKLYERNLQFEANGQTGSGKI